MAYSTEFYYGSRIDFSLRNTPPKLENTNQHTPRTIDNSEKSYIENYYILTNPQNSHQIKYEAWQHLLNYGEKYILQRLENKSRQNDYLERIFIEYPQLKRYYDNCPSSEKKEFQDLLKLLSVYLIYDCGMSREIHPPSIVKNANTNKYELEKKSYTNEVSYNTKSIVTPEWIHTRAVLIESLKDYYSSNSENIDGKYESYINLARYGGDEFILVLGIKGSLRLYLLDVISVKTVDNVDKALADKYLNDIVKVIKYQLIPQIKLILKKDTDPNKIEMEVIDCLSQFQQGYKPVIFTSKIAITEVNREEVEISKSIGGIRIYFNEYDLPMKMTEEMISNSLREYHEEAADKKLQEKNAIAQRYLKYRVFVENLHNDSRILNTGQLKTQIQKELDRIDIENLQISDITPHFTPNNLDTQSIYHLLKTKFSFLESVWNKISKLDKVISENSNDIKKDEFTECISKICYSLMQGLYGLMIPNMNLLIESMVIESGIITDVYVRPINSEDYGLGDDFLRAMKDYILSEITKLTYCKAKRLYNEVETQQICEQIHEILILTKVKTAVQIFVPINIHLTPRLLPIVTFVFNELSKLMTFPWSQKIFDGQQVRTINMDVPISIGTGVDIAGIVRATKKYTNPFAPSKFLSEALDTVENPLYIDNVLSLFIQLPSDKLLQFTNVLNTKPEQLFNNKGKLDIHTQLRSLAKEYKLIDTDDHYYNFLLPIAYLWKLFNSGIDDSVSDNLTPEQLTVLDSIKNNRLTIIAKKFVDYLTILKQGQLSDLKRMKESHSTIRNSKADYVRKLDILLQFFEKRFNFDLQKERKRLNLEEK
jgi:hypothetical protein